MSYGAYSLNGSLQDFPRNLPNAMEILSFSHLVKRTLQLKLLSLLLFEIYFMNHDELKYLHQLQSIIMH